MSLFLTPIAVDNPHIYIYIYIYGSFWKEADPNMDAQSNIFLIMGTPKGTPNLGKPPYICIYTHIYIYICIHISGEYVCICVWPKVLEIIPGR